MSAALAIAVPVRQQAIPCPPLDFATTQDLDLVRQIITVPHIYRSATDDLSPASEDFEVKPNPVITYLLVFSGDTLFGMFAFYPQNSVTWQVHTCLLENAFGWSAEIGKQAMQWIWDNTICLRITTRVPSFNKLAIRLSESVGMIRCGRDEKSFLKRGKLHDEVLLGISRPEVR